MTSVAPLVLIDEDDNRGPKARDLAAVVTLGLTKASVTPTGGAPGLVPDVIAGKLDKAGDGSSVQFAGSGRSVSGADLAANLRRLGAYVIDASDDVKPLPLAALNAYGAGGITKAQLATLLLPFSQSDGIDALFAAVRAAVIARQGMIPSLNQSYRGIVVVLWPPGLIPFHRTSTFLGGRVLWLGWGLDATVFLKLADCGNGLVFEDPRDISQTKDAAGNPQYCFGGGGAKDFGGIDLSLASFGALFCFRRPEDADYRLKTQDAFIGLRFEGYSNITLDRPRCKAGEFAFGGAYREGSAFIEFTNDPSGRIPAQNVAIKTPICAGDDPTKRFVQDGIRFLCADVAAIDAGEITAVARAGVAIIPGSGQAVQSVETVATNFDGGMRFSAYIGGIGYVDKIKIGGRAFGADQNFLRVDITGDRNITLDLMANVCGREAVVAYCNKITVRGTYRNVGSTCTANQQVSAFWFSGTDCVVRGADASPASYSLAYVVEYPDGQFGNHAQTCSVYVGANGIAGCRANAGVDLTGFVVNGGMPYSTQSTSALRTTPLSITAPLPSAT